MNNSDMTILVFKTGVPSKLNPLIIRPIVDDIERQKINVVFQKLVSQNADSHEMIQQFERVYEAILVNVTHPNSKMSK